MAGLLDAGKAPASGQQLSDPILQQIEQNLESQVPPQLKKQYLAIVVAGMSILYNEKTAQFIKQRMQASPDMVQNVSKGVADLILMVFQNSGQDKNKAQTQAFFDAAMLACITLMCQVLDMAEKLGALEVTSELVGKCTEATYKATMQNFGVTPEMVRAEMSKAQKGVDMSKPPQPTGPAAQTQPAPANPAQGA